MSHFRSLEVMDRGSEAQPQVIEVNLNKLIWQDKGQRVGLGV